MEPQQDIDLSRAEEAAYDFVGLETKRSEDVVMVRSVHDMGGLPAGEIKRDEHDFALWEKRVDAMMMLLGSKKGLMTVDELRRGIEIIGEGAYDRLGYYERWISSLTTNMVQKGYVTTEELQAKLAEIDTRRAAGEFDALEDA